MKVSDFDYELPAERIAQHPAEPRDAARLLVHEVGSGRVDHARVRDLPGYLREGDLVIVNDTRVRPARLCGRRATGAAVEVLLLEPRPEQPAGEPGEEESGASTWRAMVRPAARLAVDETVELEEGRLLARMRERLLDADGAPGPEWIVELEDAREHVAATDELLEHCGRMPLPPYIRRERDADAFRERDRADYQTVFAGESGSPRETAVAAPTAGLHFTDEFPSQLERAGIELARVTLHVGEGTFRPITVEDTQDHRMHSEAFTLSAGTVEAVERCRARGGRVVAVGTTTVRVLESGADESGALTARSGRTDLFITEGYRFRVVDALLTNFHLPKSTLLMLVSALAGRERILDLYAEALREGYRFFSYGDAMLLLPADDRPR